MSKPLLAFVSLAAVLLPALALGQADLSKYKGKSRVLLVFAPSKTDPHWKVQNALLTGSAAAFRERDLVRLDILEPGKAALRARYGIKRGQFRVLLIGKDGHVASGGPNPISLNVLTAQIDRMPMRREEVKQKEM